MRSQARCQASPRLILPLPRTSIRPATEEDIKEIAALADVIWRACYREILTPGQIDYMLKWMYAPDVLREEMRSGVRFEVLIAEDRQCGFASYGPVQPDKAIKLHKLYLNPAWHGRGLGSFLLQHCENEARRLNAHQMTLNVNKGNVRAIATYSRNGFVTAKSVVMDIGGGYVMDDYVMIKGLSSPPDVGSRP